MIGNEGFGSGMTRWLTTVAAEPEAILKLPWVSRPGVWKENLHAIGRQNQLESMR